ncbi:MAG: ABC transporter substrate-binding protein [Pseudomonadota bacterium]
MRWILTGLLAVTLSWSGADAADRIVAAGGSVTEVIYALKAEDRLVAVDTTSQYPPDAESLPDVGYFRRLSAEPILALRPDLVLAVEAAGPPAALDQLRSAGVEVVTIKDEPTPEGVASKIRQIAAALQLAAEGDALAGEVASAFEQLRQHLDRGSEPPKVLFLMTAGRGAPLSAGRNTAADAIIRLAGGENAVASFEGYKPLSPEAAIAAQPDVILCMDHTVEAMGGQEVILSIPELALTPAGRAGRLVSMEGLLLLGFGPRTPAAAQALARELGTLAAQKG